MPLSSSPSSSLSTPNPTDIKFILHENGAEPFTTELYFIRSQEEIDAMPSQYDWCATMTCHLISGDQRKPHNHKHDFKLNLYLCFDGFYDHTSNNNNSNNNNNNNNNSNNNSVQDNIKTVNYYVPLLKSNLQKAVRRQNKQAAIHTTAQLWFQDIKALVRRLPIICMEDAILHPHLAFLVWIMCAESKGFVLSRAFMYMTLGVVADLCDCPYREDNDEVAAMSVMDVRTVMKRLWHLFNGDDLSPDAMTAILSLMIRMSLGGMKGDMHLLHCLACLWIQRFSALNSSDTISQQTERKQEEQEQEEKLKDDNNNNDNNEFKIDQKEKPNSREQNKGYKTASHQFRVWNEDNFDVDQTAHSVRSLLDSNPNPSSSTSSSPSSDSMPVSFLRDEDKLPAAVDFHCTSIIHDMRSDPGVADMLAHHSDDILKSAMWHKRSKINFRQLIPGSSLSSSSSLSSVSLPAMPAANADQIEQAWCFMSEVADALSMSHWHPQEVRSPRKPSHNGRKRTRRRSRSGGGNFYPNAPAKKKSRLITDFFKS